MLFVAGMASAEPFADFDAGVAAYERGDYDAAIHHYTRALDSKDLGPHTAAFAFTNRGKSYGSTGQFDRAIEDYKQAIRLKPDMAEAFRYLGLTYFIKGDYGSAETELTKATTLLPKDILAALSLHIARQHRGIGAPAQLLKQATGFDLKKWPGPLALLFLGKITPRAALDAAKGGDRRQACVAAFYVAEYHLGHGQQSAALAQFRAAQAACRAFPDLMEHHATQAELTRVEAKPAVLLPFSDNKIRSSSAETARLPWFARINK
jgi:lipoprotein NlpI